MAVTSSCCNRCHSRALTCCLPAKLRTARHDWCTLFWRRRLAGVEVVRNQDMELAAIVVASVAVGSVVGVGVRLKGRRFSRSWPSG
jgi:hypothetical protein